MKLLPHKHRKIVVVASSVILIFLLVLSLWWFALGGGGRAPDPQTTGANPVLQTDKPIVPTVKSSNVVGWPKDAAPKAPDGFTVTALARGLDHPRWLYELPNGDILVAESATLPKKSPSLVQRLFGWLRRNDGSTQQSANRITLLRDTNYDGQPELQRTFLEGLNQPFGMALINNTLYIANTDSIVTFPYETGATHIDVPGKKILALTPDGYNNHWTRNIFPNPEGTKLYVTIGSASNNGEYGLEAEERRAVVLEINPDGSGERTIASGIRNPNGLAFEPTTKTLWTVVNERDLQGDDAVPDYLTSLRPGDSYGWPWGYWNQQVDQTVKPARPDIVAKMRQPDYSLGAHVAPLGLTFYTGQTFPRQYQGGAFIGEHGSWNRSQFVGYKVVYVPFKNGLPSGQPQDFLTGFMPDQKDALTYGRPVGVITDRSGALLVADDAGNSVWRVTYEQ